MKLFILFYISLFALISNAKDLNSDCTKALKENYFFQRSYWVDACQSIRNVHQLKCMVTIAEAKDMSDYKAYYCINGVTNANSATAIDSAYDITNSNSDKIVYYLANITTTSQMWCVQSVTKYYRLSEETTYNCVK